MKLSLPVMVSITSLSSVALGAFYILRGSLWWNDSSLCRTSPRHPVQKQILHIKKEQFPASVLRYTVHTTWSCSANSGFTVGTQGWEWVRRGDGADSLPATFQTEQPLYKSPLGFKSLKVARRRDRVGRLHVVSSSPVTEHLSFMAVRHQPDLLFFNPPAGFSEPPLLLPSGEKQSRFLHQISWKIHWFWNLLLSRVKEKLWKGTMV